MRRLKACGLVAQPFPSSRPGVAALPGISVQQPGKGYFHPATRAEIVRVLRFFGEVCFYGLRAIELVQGPVRFVIGEQPLGRFFTPGRIRLYAQPVSPWLIAGRLPLKQRTRLERAGAVVEEAGTGTHTTVRWTAKTLRDFMLFDVLMHEIGHHRVQQYRGKRKARLLRTKDHEAFADHFARQCRLAWQRATPQA